MSDAPNKIWLQRPNRDPENEFCGEVTWCESKQNDDDTCYIKASAKTADLANEIDTLKAQCDELLRTMRRAVVCAAHDSKEAKEECYRLLDEAIRTCGAPKP